MQRSSPSVHHHAGVTDMLIYRMFTRRRARSPRRSLSLPSSLPSRRSRWVRAMRSNALFASCGLTSMLPLSQIPNSCEKGAAIHDFKHPDRIVIGTDDERAKRVLAEIYRPLYLNQAPILYTGRRTSQTHQIRS